MSKTGVVLCGDAQQARFMMTVESGTVGSVQWHISKRTRELGTTEDKKIMPITGLTREADSRWFNQGKKHAINISYHTLMRYALA